MSVARAVARSNGPRAHLSAALNSELQVLASRIGNLPGTGLTIAHMVADDLPILYTKRGCPWCHQAVEFLDSHGIGYKLREVTSDASAMAEMQKKSGQTRAPTLDWHGKVLADFGVDELVPFLRQQNVKLEDS